MRTQLTPTERETAAPTFRPMPTVAKRSTISAAAELLLNFAVCRDAARRAGSSATADTGILLVQKI